MSMNRTGKLIVSCCGAAIVVAAAGIVIVGASRRHPAGIVPAKLASGGRTGVADGPSPTGAGPNAGGPLSAVAGPVALPGPGETGRIPDTVTESLVLQKGETYYGKGEAFFRDGDFVSASRYLQAEVDTHPDRFYPSYLLGIAQWKDGVLDGAIVSLTRAATLDPKSVKARVNLGRALNDAGRFEDALKATDEALAVDSGDSAASNVRGRALLNLGRKDEAIEAFKTAVEKDPGDAYARNNLGYALIGAGRFSDAVPFLEEAVRLKPGVGIFQNNLGMAYERTAHKDLAIVAYRAAAKTGGSDAAERNLSRLGGSVDDDSVEPNGVEPASGITTEPSGPDQN